MSLLIPYHVSIGSLTLEAGSGAGPYHITGMRFPAPAPDGRGGWEPAVRSIDVRITGTTDALLASNTAALHRACVRDNYINFRRDSTSPLLSSRIREAVVNEGAVDLLNTLERKRYVTITLTTDSHWLAPWGSWTTITAPAPAPGHFDIPAAGGDDDALVDLRIIPGIAANGIIVGGWPNPAAGYAYSDTYSSSFEFGYPNWTRLPGAPAINSIANRGRHITVLYSSGIATGVRVRSAISTAGYSITTAIPDVIGQERTRDTQLKAIELPIVTIPGSAIPESINGTSFTTNHHIEGIDQYGASISFGTVQRIPVDYAAFAYRGATHLPQDVGVVYSGDTDTLHIADVDGIGGSIMAGADIMRPLRAAPGVVTRMVYGFTAEAYTTAYAYTTKLMYRVRPRYLTAAG